VPAALPACHTTILSGKPFHTSRCAQQRCDLECESRGDCCANYKKINVWTPRATNTTLVFSLSVQRQRTQRFVSIWIDHSLRSQGRAKSVRPLATKQTCLSTIERRLLVRREVHTARRLLVRRLSRLPVLCCVGCLSHRRPSARSSDFNEVCGLVGTGTSSCKGKVHTPPPHAHIRMRMRTRAPHTFALSPSVWRSCRRLLGLPFPRIPALLVHRSPQSHSTSSSPHHALCCRLCSATRLAPKMATAAWTFTCVRRLAPARICLAPATVATSLVSSFTSQQHNKQGTATKTRGCAGATLAVWPTMTGLSSIRVVRTSP